MCKRVLTSSKPTYYLNTERNPEKRCGGHYKGMLHTWYTYQIALRNAKGPRGGAWVQEFARHVYYKDGRFYMLKTHKSIERTATRDTYATMEPISGPIWTVHPKYQARYNLPDAEIVLSDGVPVIVKVDGNEFEITPDEWPMVEGYLGLDEQYKPERFRPKKECVWNG